MGWYNNTERKLFFLKLTYLVIGLKIICLILDKLCHSFYFLKLVTIKLCHVYFDLPSIFDIICDFEFLNSLKHLSFPNAFFRFTFPKNLLEVCAVDHLFKGCVKSVIWSFDFQFSLIIIWLSHYFLLRVGSFYFLHLFILNLKETSNFVYRKYLFRLYAYLSINNNFFRYF